MVEDCIFNLILGDSLGDTFQLIQANLCNPILISNTIISTGCEQFKVN
jgi:hypothetical protein